MILFVKYLLLLFFSESAMLELVLVRHGETDSNKTHTIQVSELLDLFFFRVVDERASPIGANSCPIRGFVGSVLKIIYTTLDLLN